MIKGTFRRDVTGSISSFELTGHAGAGEYGQDIVCAAVSALAISAINGIDSLASVEMLIEVNEEEGGYLYAELPKDMSQEQRSISQILLENLLLGLQAVQVENSDNIQINTQSK